MRYGIVTPAHNESDAIFGYMESVVRQSVRPVALIIVNDHSTDNTGHIAREIAKKHDWITIFDRKSDPDHATGSKVAGAFLYGLDRADTTGWDVIVKMDADLVLPHDYFSTVLEQFQKDGKTGICGGVCALRQGDRLVPETLTDRFHVRGALKAYRRECYEQIGGIRQLYGWDTLDELLAAYYGWGTRVIPDLLVEHRSPTGIETQPAELHKMTGELFYRLGYGPVVSLLASVKRYRMKPRFASALLSFSGYLRAAISRPEQYVTPAQRIFIRKLRYRRMREKLK